MTTLLQQLQDKKTALINAQIALDNAIAESTNAKGNLDADANTSGSNAYVNKICSNNVYNGVMSGPDSGLCNQVKAERQKIIDRYNSETAKIKPLQDSITLFQGQIQALEKDPNLSTQIASEAKTEDTKRYIYIAGGVLLLILATIITISIVRKNKKSKSQPAA